MLLLFTAVVSTSVLDAMPPKHIFETSHIIMQQYCVSVVLDDVRHVFALQHVSAVISANVLVPHAGHTSVSQSSSSTGRTCSTRRRDARCRISFMYEMFVGYPPFINGYVKITDFRAARSSSTATLGLHSWYVISGYLALTDFGVPFAERIALYRWTLGILIYEMLFAAC